MMPDHQVTLALRPDEQPHLYRQRPSLPTDGSLYALMLRSTPAFPGQVAGGQSAGDSRSLLLICAHYGRHGWAWITLEANTRQLLENTMRQQRAVIDRWYYMELVRGIQ